MKNILQPIKIIILALILVVGISYLHAAWVGPTATPPNENTPAPVNVGSIFQEKSGDLWARTMGTDRGYCIGSDCISAWPSAVGVFTEYFESAEQAILVASTGIVAHGLGAVPVLYTVSLRNKIAEHGYNVGDELAYIDNPHSDQEEKGHNSFASATVIGLVVHSGGILIASRAVNDIVGLTPANWRWIARAWR